ncbi:hypothetical protein PENSUB_10643 [Penicillium subrubescens]|uniref:Uncharacterized protein n=2 Tax=Penicillium subrubescens TaxID=1316194 RepID=A0A1Q5T8F1_9EURO|nr:hypothetical protein PENSUB_10643 [Penicillium subrubescens]
MEYARHDSTMYASLNTPGRPTNLRGILDPGIAEEKLEMLYRQLADILRELPMLTFSRTGSLHQKDESRWEVAYRPLTLNMEQMVVTGTLPPTHLPDPDATFATSASYLQSVAESFVQHLHHQRNNAIESADDCRRKTAGRAEIFGPTNDPENDWKERLALLSDDDHAEMEKLVIRKLGEMKNRELAWDCDEYTRFLSDAMKNDHECNVSEVTNDPSEHSLESAHSMAMFQGILDFAAKKNTTAATGTTRT